jgi:chorismate mutase/prephenate dehydratase
VSDDQIRALRSEIEENDLELLAALNRRLELVARLKQVKEEHGIEFVDPERERALLTELERANGGPLSAEGVRAFFVEVLALTKRELAR